jgi:nitrite reductase/ring-hydroxylating ferredoxin subunit
MKFFRQPSKEPLWKEELPIRRADETYVSRRQFTKFLVMTSLGMFVGNLWILARTWFYKEPVFPEMPVARAGEIPIGGVKLFRYPTEHDPCILVRLGPEDYVAYSQMCTHLECPVFYSASRNQLVCPCHQGFFSARTGEVLQGPPPRALPRVALERRQDQLIAVAMETLRRE